MRLSWKKTMALLLALALTAVLLPAAGAADPAISGDQARAAVLARVDEITGVRWTLDGKRIEWNALTQEQTAAMHAAGGFPATWFEYKRLHFTFKGLPVSTDAVTPEAFAARLDPAAAVEPGVPVYHSTTSLGVGLDVNTFLTELTGRVMKTPVTGLKAALTDPGLVPLAKAEPTAASSRAALGSAAAAAEGYAKLGPGDLLLAWDDAADPESMPCIHAMAVRSADASARTVTVTYPSYSKVLWYFVCDTCGKREMEGPTSAVCPDHVESSASKTFSRFKTHAETDASSRCGGTWKAEYGTIWRDETLTFDQLWNAVNCGGAGYVPFTLAAYQTGLAPADVKFATGITPQNYTGGFTADVTSDYVITGARAVLTEAGAAAREFPMAVPRGSRAVSFRDPELDLAMMDCRAGTANNLSFFVRSGPMSAVDAAAGDWRRVFSMDFTVQNAAVRLIPDRAKAEQGEAFTVEVRTIGAGYTGLRVAVEYDRNSYVFDPAASRAQSPGVTVTEQDGRIVCLRLGGALSADTAAAKLIFAPVRTGLFPAAAEENGVIRCRGAEVTDKAAPAASDLVAAGLDAVPVRMATGYNTQIFRDFCRGYDLILVYTMSEAQRTDNRSSKTKLTYGGQPMYDVTRAKYAVVGDCFLRTYGYLAQNADPALVAAGDKDCPELPCDLDVNGSGTADLNDVQALADLLRGSLPPEGNLHKWITADIDRSGKVDQNDCTALWNALTK